MSLVLKPLASVFFTAFSISAEISSSPNVLIIIAAERIVARGLALSCPTMSGADPWMGSKSPGIPFAPKEAEGSIPMEPAICPASSERISPKRLLVTMTSKLEGLPISCIAALST